MPWIKNKDGKWVDVSGSSGSSGSNITAGSSGSVTKAKIVNALGYTPANQKDVDDLSKVLGNGGFMKADMAPLILDYIPGGMTEGYTGQLAYNTTDSGVYICLRGNDPNKDAGSEGVTMFSWSKAKAYKSSNVAPTTNDAGNFGDLWVDYKSGSIYVSAGRTVGSGGYIYVWNKVGGDKDLTKKVDQLSEAIADLPKSNDEEIEMLIMADLLPAVTTQSGAVLADNSGNVILRY